MAVKVRKVEIPGAPGKFRRVLSVQAKEFERKGGLLTPEMREAKRYNRAILEIGMKYIHGLINEKEMRRQIGLLREKGAK